LKRPSAIHHILCRRRRRRRRRRYGRSMLETAWKTLTLVNFQKQSPLPFVSVLQASHRLPPEHPPARMSQQALDVIAGDSPASAQHLTSSAKLPAVSF
jgi:hypothetical protein